MDYFEVYSLVFLDTALELCLFYINLCFLSEFQAKTLPCSTREQSLQYKVIPGTRMLSRQSTLPKLPVPPLEQTLQKFLRSVKPLNSPEDFRNAEKVSVGSFLEVVSEAYRHVLRSSSKSLEDPEAKARSCRSCCRRELTRRPTG